MVIDYRKEGRIAIFTLNRPPVNAVNMELVRELRETLMSFRDDPDLWVGDLALGRDDPATAALGEVRKVTDLGAQTDPYI